jgi:hypothetical protein
MLWLMKGLVLIVIMGLMLQFCSVRLDDGSRALRVKVDVNDMGGTGLSISVTRLTVDEPPERPRNFR